MEPNERQRAAARKFLDQHTPWLNLRFVDPLASAFAEFEREVREVCAQEVEARGRKIGGAIDPKRTAAALRGASPQPNDAKS